MNKRTAKAKLFRVQDRYMMALRAIQRSHAYQQRGYTTQCIAQHDKALAYIRDAEATIAALETMIDEVSA